MSQFYMQRDADGFGAKLATALTADDDATKWIMVTIAADNDIDFKQNFQRYQIHNDGTVVRGGDSAVTVEALNKRLATALETIEADQKTIESLKKALGDATKAQVEAQKTFTITTSQFQTQFGEITKAQVELGKQIQALATK